MQLIKGKPSDIDQLVALYQRVVQRMNEQGIDQWDTTYPSREILSDDLEKGELFWFIEDEQPVGAVVLNQAQDPEYGIGSWEDTTGNEIVIHRFSVDPNFQGQGLAKKMMVAIEEFAQKQGNSSVRLDTYTKNPIAVRLYEKCGYQLRGQFNNTWREAPLWAGTTNGPARI